MKRARGIAIRRGDLTIAVQRLPNCVKPALTVSGGLMIHKVATFSNEEAADIFTDALLELLGEQGEEKED